MRYWIGPWLWHTTPRAAWYAPAAAVGMIDLRPLPAQAQAIAASGIGFFATDDAADLGLVGDYTLLGQGDLRSLTPIAKSRRALASALGLNGLAGATLIECLWDAMTVQADHTGASGVKPLMPTSSRVLELHLGGHSLVMAKVLDLAMPEAENVKALMQEDFRALQLAAAAGLVAEDVPQK